MNYSKRKSNGFNYILFISTLTIFLLLYLFQKNKSIYYIQERKKLNKKLIFYTNQVNSNKGSITGLRRSDRIRTIAEKELNMYFPQPETLKIITNE